MFLRRLLENSITVGLLFLAVFTPLAFGTVQPWATLALQLIVLLMTAAWLARLWTEERLVVHTTWLYAPIILFIGYALVQNLPLPVMEPAPGGLTNTFLAHSAVIQKLGETQIYTISLCRHATFISTLRLAIFGLVFFLAINELRTLKRVQTVLYVLVVLGFCVALFALIQKFTWTGKIYWLQETPANAGPYGPFVNYDHYGGYINMIIPLGIALLMTRLSISQRILIGFMTGVMATSMLLSRSRGAVISFIGALLVFLLLLVISRKQHKRLVLVTVLLLVAFIGAFVYWVDFGGFLARIRTIGLEQNFFNPRLDVWKDAMGIINDFGVFGTGLGTFSEVFPKYQSTHLNLFWRYLHNDYLQIFCETGIIGFTAVAAFMVLFWWNILSHLRVGTNQRALCLLLGTATATATMFIHSLFDFNLHINANTYLFALLLGVTHVLTRYLVEPHAEPHRDTRKEDPTAASVARGPASFRDPYAEFEEQYRKKKMIEEMRAQQSQQAGELSTEEMQRDLERLKAQFPDGLPPELGGIPIATPVPDQGAAAPAPSSSATPAAPPVTAPATLTTGPTPSAKPTAQPPAEEPADAADDDSEEERGQYLDVQLGAFSGALWCILSIGLLVVVLALPAIRWYLGDRYYREYLDIVRLNQFPESGPRTTDPNRTGFMRFWSDPVLGQAPFDNIDQLKEHYLTQATRLDPLRPVYYHHLGHLFVARAAKPGTPATTRDSLLEKALQYYTKAVSRSPLNAAYWFSCAWTLGNLQQRDEGWEILKYVLLLAPEREFYKKHAADYRRLFKQKPKPTFDEISPSPRAARKTASANAQQPRKPPTASLVPRPTATPDLDKRPPSQPPSPAPVVISSTPSSTGPKTSAPLSRSTMTVAPARTTTAAPIAPATQPIRQTTTVAPAVHRATGIATAPVQRSTVSAVRTSTAATRILRSTAPVYPAATVRSTTAPTAATSSTVKPSTATPASPGTNTPRKRGITAPVGGW